MSKLLPLVEVLSPSEANVRLVERDAAGGTKQAWLEMTVQTADRLNRNKRVYPRSVMERELASFQEHIKAGTSYGEADHPEPGRAPSVTRQAILWKKAWMEKDGTVRADGVVLETSAGRDVRAILEAGGAIGSSSRGRGTIRTAMAGEIGVEGVDRSEQVEVVNDDYRLRTFDLVIDQSVPEAVSRLTRYEQHLIEQESQEDGSMQITLESLEKDHPATYKSLIEACKGKMKKEDEDEMKTRLAAAMKEREESLKAAVIESLQKEGRLLSPEQVERVRNLEAFRLVLVETMKEGGLLEGVDLAEEEVQTRVQKLESEKTDLARKLEQSQRTIAELSEKLGKGDVEAAAKKLAENHALADELTKDLVESCRTMDEFTARSGAIKGRYDRLAERITQPALPTGQGNNNLSEPIRKDTPKDKDTQLTEGQIRLRQMAGING